MKQLITTAVAALVLAGCGENTQTGKVPDEVVNKIPDEGVVMVLPAAGYSTEQNFKKVVPGKAYNYWALMQGGYGSAPTVLYAYGDEKALNGIELHPKDLGLGSESLLPVSGGYLLAVKDKKPHYFGSAEQITGFLGNIDNLEEALIVAAYNNFIPDSTLNANTYYRKHNNYVLRLTHNQWDPDGIYTDEVVEVTVNPEGFIKTRSLSVERKRLSR